MVPQMRPRVRSRLGATAAVFMLATALGALFLHLLGIDALEGRSDFDFYADSTTYHSLARGDLAGVEGATDLISVAANFLGPLLILRLADENYYLVLMINAALMFASIASIARTIGLNSLRLATLLFLNPLTVSSLLSVNKEILSLVFVALLLRSFASRSITMFLLAAVTSLLVRWQLTLVLVVLVALVHAVPAVGRRRRLVFIALLFALSALYTALLTVFEPVRATFELSASEYEGSGLYEWLVAMQEAGAYWAVFPLKAAHLLFGMGLRLDRLVAPTNIYNDVWQLLHSTATLLMFVSLWRARRLDMNSELIFMSAIYIAIFALSPIYAPRYFYAVYVLWAVALAAPTRVVQFAPRPLRRRRDTVQHAAPGPATPTPLTR